MAAPQQEFAPSYKASDAEATEQCFEPDSATLGGKLGFVVLVGLGENKVESFRRAGSIPHCGNMIHESRTINYLVAWRS